MAYSGVLRMDQRLAQRGLHALAAWNRLDAEDAFD